MALCIKLSKLLQCLDLLSRHWYVTEQVCDSVYAAVYWLSNEFNLCECFLLARYDFVWVTCVFIKFSFSHDTPSALLYFIKVVRMNRYTLDLLNI